jgi:Methyltransferase domain
MIIQSQNKGATMKVEGMEVTPYALSPQLVYLRYLAEWSDIQDHLPRLKEAAKGNVLEIGVRTGISTAALLTGVKLNGGHVYSVDIADCNVFPNDPDWTFRQFDSLNTGRSQALKNLGFDPAFLNDSGIIPFDMVLIDGNHSFNACLTDLKRYGALAPRIFLHDSDMESVREAIDVFMDEHKDEFSLTFYHGSNGLAELQREATVIDATSN